MTLIQLVKKLLETLTVDVEQGNNDKSNKSEGTYK
jgi:hypothetical protein